MDKIRIDWEGFDVPEQRKAIWNPSNLRWMARNIGVRNSAHPRLSEVVEILRGWERIGVLTRREDAVGLLPAESREVAQLINRMPKRPN